MFVTVVGGGNSSPIFATLCKLAGHTVAILTRKPEAWDHAEIGFQNEDPEYVGGQEMVTCKADLITSDPALCIPQSDMIFIAGLPIHLNPVVVSLVCCIVLLLLCVLFSIFCLLSASTSFITPYMYCIVFTTN